MRVTLRQILETTKRFGDGWTIFREKGGDGDYGFDEIYEHGGQPIFRIHIPGCRLGVYAETMKGWPFNKE